MGVGNLAELQITSCSVRTFIFYVIIINIIITISVKSNKSKPDGNYMTAIYLYRRVLRSKCG